MKPWKTLATAPSAGGDSLVLQERGGVYVIRHGGHELMSSASHGSEEAMARGGLHGLSVKRPVVLIGGLGMGYTLRAALDCLPPSAQVVVAEIASTVVAWNRGPLASLARAPLEDLRVQVEVADLQDYVARTSLRFHALLVDVDNGPSAMREGNEGLYGLRGLRALRRVLLPGGRLVLWSAGPHPGFVRQLERAGFDAHEERLSARPGGAKRHVLFLAKVPGAAR